MSARTTIEWTDETWNPVRGCALVSPGCTNCYAMRQAHRFAGNGKPYEGLTRMTGHGPVWMGRARLVPEMLDAPLRWRKPRRVFVNSMSDLFHEDLSNEEIAAVFGAMACCSMHTFQVLTKRTQRMREWFEWLDAEAADVHAPAQAFHCGIEATNHGADVDALGLPDVWPLPNVWLGVSVEDQRHAVERLPDLLRVPAAVRFLSCEPLLGPIDLVDAIGIAMLNLDMLESKDMGIHWVIVGGESGPGARECHESWLRTIVDQCHAAAVPVFVKQLGAQVYDDVTWRGSEPRYELRDCKGGDPAEWPAYLRVRQFPEVRP